VLDLPERIDDVFRALADPTRRQIIERLDEGPASVSTLARPFPITLAAVTQHVQVLERARLVRTTKIGRERICQLDVEHIDVARSWLDDRRQRWAQRLERLDEFIAAQPADGHDPRHHHDARHPHNEGGIDHA
jgi:DNA-binding transcriptional ArsR family regulator